MGSLCPQEAESVTCDFEESLCGYTSDGSIYYNDWLRTNGSDTNSGIIDHTLGTSYGYYMYAPQEKDDSFTNLARLQSVLITDTGVKCLSFYYNMYGDQYNMLNILLKQTNPYVYWTVMNEDLYEYPDSVKKNKIPFKILSADHTCVNKNFRSIDPQINIFSMIFNGF